MHPCIFRSSCWLGGAALLFALAIGCGTSVECDLSARAGLTVTVLNADAGRVCDATVRASGGSYSEVLRVHGDAASCTYAGAWERTGTYAVEVSAGSKTKTVTGIVVGPGQCHVDGQAVSVTLDP